MICGKAYSAWFSYEMVEL